ncbi:MAG: hypothetical protein ACKVQK_22535 [Burkholderiales bacterium]
MLSSRQTLEGKLAKAEANLKIAVTQLAGATGDQSAARENLERARSSCREAHAAVVKLDYTGR